MIAPIRLIVTLLAAVALLLASHAQDAPFECNNVLATAVHRT